MTQMFSGVRFNPATGALEDVTEPVPVPEGHDLLVRVAAVSLNPVDLRLRQMLPKEAPPMRLGFDAVGTVEACGDSVATFQPGDRVWYAGSAKRHGSNGAYQLVDARIVGRAPETLNDADAAALPLTAITAWEALFERLAFEPLSEQAQPGRLLMINGAGGVGSVAVQLAKLSKIEVTATASRDESVQWCRDMGAAHVVDHAALADLPDMSFDRILCAHDTDAYFSVMSRLVAPLGMICSVVGVRQQHDLMPLFNKSAGFIWEYMFARSTHGTADMHRQGEMLSRMAALADAGALKTTGTTTLRGLDAQRLQEAHDMLATGRQIGKLVITL